MKVVVKIYLKKSKGVNKDIIVLSEVGKTGVEFIKRENCHNIWYRGQKDKEEHGVGFLVNKELAGNIENLYNFIE